jgi:hypothetical protein
MPEFSRVLVDTTPTNGSTNAVSSDGAFDALALKADKLTQVAIANLATGGSIGTAAATVDVAGVLVLGQTTAGQSLTMPTPTTAATVRTITLVGGTVDTTVTGAAAGSDSYILRANKTTEATWNGSLWRIHHDHERLVGPSGEVVALSEVIDYENMTATGIAFSGACELAGYDCTVAAGNITIYDGVDATGTVIVAATALTVGRVEFTWKRALLTGCYVVLSGAATVNVLVGP